VPIALLNGFLRDCSGVAFLSSAASRRESMLKELSDIPQAEPCRSIDTGVEATRAVMYFSCSNDDVLSDELAEISILFSFSRFS
jgi:hypothetical protein